MMATPAAAVDKLIRMANQIALAFHAEPRDAAVADIATHIKSFWTPKMRRDIGSHLAEGGSRLDPLAKAAIERLTMK
jgi:formate dehydrogenase subunit delta